jgi:signal-transduction protein with cAMP-binding, CBS, and nucleotidyltransferase domain
MLTRNVGSLVVVDRHDHPLGIVTDRDLALRVLAPGLPETTPVQEVMTGNPRVVRETHEIDAALNIMQDTPCRRLPVIDDDGAVIGILTLDDIHQYHAEEASMMGFVLRREKPGVVAED